VKEVNFNGRKIYEIRILYLGKYLKEIDSWKELEVLIIPLLIIFLDIKL
jgi:hypothetical protein